MVEKNDKMVWEEILRRFLGVEQLIMIRRAGAPLEYWQRAVEKCVREVLEKCGVGVVALFQGEPLPPQDIQDKAAEIILKSSLPETEAISLCYVIAHASEKYKEEAWGRFPKQEAPLGYFRFLIWDKHAPEKWKDIAWNEFLRQYPEFTLSELYALDNGIGSRPPTKWRKRFESARLTALAREKEREKEGRELTPLEQMTLKQLLDSLVH